MSQYQRILVTAALPYANGPIHLGHLSGAYLPADIYVRYQRMRRRAKGAAENLLGAEVSGFAGRWQAPRGWLFEVFHLVEWSDLDFRRPRHRIGNRS